MLSRREGYEHRLQVTTEGGGGRVGHRRQDVATLSRWNRDLYSRHDFQLAQLFACLVLRKFFRTDYRGIVAILQDWPLVREKLRLNKTPHFTTLQKAERRLLTDPLIRKLLTQTIETFYDHGRHRSTPATPPTPSNSPPPTPPASCWIEPADTSVKNNMKNNVPGPFSET